MFKNILEILSHLVSLVIVISASKFIETKIGHAFFLKIEQNGWVENSIIVASCVFIYSITIQIFKLIRFLFSSKRNFDGFYIEYFIFSNSIHIAIFRIYSKFWSGSQLSDIVGRCYIYDSENEKFTQHADWSSHHQIQQTESSLLYIYKGTNVTSVSYGFAKIETANNVDFQGYFADLEGGIEVKNGAKKVSINAVKMDKNAFVKEVIPSWWRRRFMMTYNVLIRNGLYLDKYMSQINIRDFKIKKFISDKCRGEIELKEKYQRKAKRRLTGVFIAAQKMDN